MNILLFGATGGTGRQVLKQGLEKGYHITAFVRNPAALTIKDKKLFIVKGDIADASQITTSIKDQDVVISTLGVKTTNALFHENTIISDGVRTIISAMRNNRVKRFIFVASFGVNRKIFFPEKLFMRTVLKNIFADIPRQENVITKSGLDWTIVHPARLTNGIYTGNYRIGGELPIGLFSHISRADVADFLLKAASSREFVHKIITISS